MGANKNERGDYQTPLWFACEVCRKLRDVFRESPTLIWEPTCGMGNFIEAARRHFDCRFYAGLEINHEYALEASGRFPSDSTKISCGDVFQFTRADFPHEITSSDSLLLLGNPPWVTNSYMSVLKGDNRPARSNFKKMRGIDAITGDSNFDICEYIIIDTLKKFSNTPGSLAMLCKTSCARRVYSEICRQNIAASDVRICMFDAKKVFGISAECCLFYLKRTSKNNQQPLCKVCMLDNLDEEIDCMAYQNGVLTSTRTREEYNIDGESCFVWRQGVKHDCSKIMEFELTDAGLKNGGGSVVELENDLLYPLIKSSQIKQTEIAGSSKRVLITQKFIGDDTNRIKNNFPLTWKYLQENANAFAARKSIIYKNSPQFGIFGIGDYAFCPYKVAVSGFYKVPRFALLHNSKPFMLDDTCYYIGFDRYDHAYIATILLNSDIVQSFLKSITFPDSKRPYTKKVLNRIDFGKALSKMSLNDLRSIERSVMNRETVDDNQLQDFKRLIRELSMQQMEFSYQA